MEKPRAACGDPGPGLPACGGPAWGIGLVDPCADLDLDGFELLDNTLAGLVVAATPEPGEAECAGAVSLLRGLVAGNGLGVATDGAAQEVEPLLGEVDLRENGADLDQLPVGVPPAGRIPARP